MFFTRRNLVFPCVFFICFVIRFSLFSAHRIKKKRFAQTINLSSGAVVASSFGLRGPSVLGIRGDYHHLLSWPITFCKRLQTPEARPERVILSHGNHCALFAVQDFLPLLIYVIIDHFCKMFTEHLNEKLPRSPLFPPRAALANSSKELFCSVAGGKRKHCCLHTLPVSVGRITFTFCPTLQLALIVRPHTRAMSKL